MYNVTGLSQQISYPITALVCLLMALQTACAPSTRTDPSIQPPIATEKSQGTEPSFTSSPEANASAAEQTPQTDTTRTFDKPIAIIEGRRVTWDQLQPLLAEASGGMVLEEHILHQQINEELAKANITLSPKATDQEKEILLESLNDDPDMAIRLLNEIKIRQGLGSHRFDNLLWRNAALRALVQDDVRLQDDAIERLYDVMYGAKRTGRIAVYSDLKQAHGAKERIEAGEPFIDIVVETSIAPSAATGGKFGPLSRNDPEYPSALRTTLWGMEPGQYSSPVLFQERYAIIEFLEETPAADLSLQEATPELQRALRLTQERLLMSQLARGLVDGAEITVFDLSLQKSHEQYKRQQTQ